MSGYGQFCPVAKAMELLDERWTMLVVRELLLGSRHFNDLRRGVPSSHVVFGEAMAILAGDGLLALAFEIIARHVRQPPHGACRPRSGEHPTSPGNMAEQSRPHPSGEPEGAADRGPVSQVSRKQHDRPAIRVGAGRRCPTGHRNHPPPAPGDSQVR